MTGYGERGTINLKCIGLIEKRFARASACLSVSMSDNVEHSRLNGSWNAPLPLSLSVLFLPLSSQHIARCIPFIRKHVYLGPSPTPYIEHPSSDGYERGMNTDRFGNISNYYRSYGAFESNAARRYSFTNSRRLLCRLIRAATAGTFENHESMIIPANAAA